MRIDSITSIADGLNPNRIELVGKQGNSPKASEIEVIEAGIRFNRDIEFRAVAELPKENEDIQTMELNLRVASHQAAESALNLKKIQKIGSAKALRYQHGNLLDKEVLKKKKKRKENRADLTVFAFWPIKGRSYCFCDIMKSWRL